MHCENEILYAMKRDSITIGAIKLKKYRSHKNTIDKVNKISNQHQKVKLCPHDPKYIDGCQCWK